MKFEYDKSADVMYVTLAERDPGQCRFRENENGDILRIDKSTDEIVGVTIISFLFRIQKGFAIELTTEDQALGVKK